MRLNEYGKGEAATMSSTVITLDLDHITFIYVCICNSPAAKWQISFSCLVCYRSISLKFQFMLDPGSVKHIAWYSKLLFSSNLRKYYNELEDWITICWYITLKSSWSIDHHVTTYFVKFVSPVFVFQSLLLHVYIYFFFCILSLHHSLMWHPSGESSAFIVLADCHILMCDLQPSGQTARVVDFSDLLIYICRLPMLEHRLPIPIALPCCVLWLNVAR